MKRFLVMAASTLIAVYAIAQNTMQKKCVNFVAKCDLVKHIDLTDAENSADSQWVPFNVNRCNFKSPKTTTGITKTYIGTSSNVYSVILSEQTCLTANEETGLIMMTHRGDGTTFGSGSVQCSFSADSGVTFDNSTVVIWNGISPNLARYPSGVIYNPDGNTDPANAFAVAAGPRTDVSGIWLGGFFASEKLNGTLNNSQTTSFTTDTLGGAGQINRFPRMHMQSRGGKIFLYGHSNTDNGTYYTSFKTVINIGTWNTMLNKVDWTTVAHTPGFFVNNAGYPAGNPNPGFVMADDGLTGYLIYTGRDSTASDLLSFIPIIYKTIDGGMTWVKQAAFDWAAIPAVQSFAAGYSPVSRPSFDYVKDAVIDADGRLHFACFIRGATSNHVDSLNFYNFYFGLKGFVFDTYQTASGWNSIIVDTVFAADADENNTLISPGTSNAVSMDERFQMSRTQDGSKIFYSWLDTDSDYSEFNIFPDIFVKMYDVASGTMSPTINLTDGTNYIADNFWLCLGDIAFDMDSIYQLHMSTSTLNMVASGPVDHEYINNVYLTEYGNLLTGPSAPSATNWYSYCQFETSAQLTAYGSNLLWYTTPTGGIGSPAAPTPNTTIPGTQYYYVSQTENGLESARSQITVNVYAIPPTPVITLHTDTLVSDAAFGNQWYDADGPITGADNEYYIVTENGNYFVIVSINGCDSDSSNIISLTNVGMNKNDVSISIFPIPATNRITISGIEYGGTLRLFDLSGKLLSEDKNGDNTLELNGIAAGCYILEARTESGVVRRRVVVE